MRTIFAHPLLGANLITLLDSAPLNTSESTSFTSLEAPCNSSTVAWNSYGTRMELAYGSSAEFATFSIVSAILRYVQYCVVGVILGHLRCSIRDHFWTWAFQPSLNLPMPPWTSLLSIDIGILSIDLDSGNACNPIGLCWTHLMRSSFLSIMHGCI
jgi:hypothetical protein